MIHIIHIFPFSLKWTTEQRIYRIYREKYIYFGHQVSIKSCVNIQGIPDCVYQVITINLKEYLIGTSKISSAA